LRSVTGQQGYQSTLKEVQDFIGGNKQQAGLLERYSRNFVYDTYSQVDRVTASTFADRLQLDYAIYEGGLIKTSRPFCKKMLTANKLYRKEDIITMGKKSTTNPGWGPEGVDEYSVWFFKGGGSCGHVWRRETYRRIGSFNQKGDNKKEVTPSQARKEGEIVPTVDSPLVYQKPIDMPYQGFLPTNPRFKNK